MDDFSNLTWGPSAASSDPNSKPQGHPRPYGPTAGSGTSMSRPSSHSSSFSSNSNPAGKNEDPFADLVCFQPAPKEKSLLERQQEQERKINASSRLNPAAAEKPRSPSVSPASTKNSGFDFNTMDLEYLSPKPPQRSASESPKNSPFDFLDQTPINSNKASDQDPDDILGLLGKPVEEVHRIQSASPQASSSVDLDDKLARLMSLGHDFEVAKLSLDFIPGGTVEEAHTLILQNQKMESEFNPNGRKPVYEKDGYSSEGSNHEFHYDSPKLSNIPALFNKDTILKEAGEVGSSVLSAASSIFMKSKQVLQSKWDELQSRSNSGSATPGSVWSVSDADSFHDYSNNSFADEEEPQTSQFNHRATTKSRLGSSHSSNISARPALSIASVIMPQDTVKASSEQQLKSGEERQAGNTQFKLGQYNEAIEFYTQAIESLPSGHSNQIPLFNNRATASAKVGDFKASASDADAAISLIGHDRDYMPESSIPGRAGLPLKELYAKAVLLKARALEAMEKYKQASEAYGLLLKANPMPLRSQAMEGAQRCRKALQAPSTPKAFHQSTSTPISSYEVDSNASVRKLREKEAQLAAEEAQRFEAGDSIEARVSAWRKGRENNIRALLSSLDALLWPELQWENVGLHDLLEPKGVKRHYLRAVAKIHPDKLLPTTSVEHKLLAGHIFNHLNTAWDSFRAENNC
ncbi:auxilin-like clathrin-binding protein required for normal clathrin function [Entomophthora muscae]|uniref:Auxilin-like clathrin-binding protein required for normal clathrin function n=1 Tax=Entomophthora muscae TaxID=34485 RepID=A0ACC2T1H7_9FUNG|nr:auxilin-like clathrin-binding protein required for normal clathrin function [Entomophthora muscae]